MTTSRTKSTTTSTRHLTSAIALALALTACGGSDTATPAAPASGGTAGNAADVAFLRGMGPHHEQAVEMSDLVLAADPPAPVAELARQVKAAQAPEIEQIEQMLDDLGQDADGHHAGDAAGHGGMMSHADMERLEDATGADAARIYLEGMIEHHEGAVASAEAQIADGEHEPAVELARVIAKDQAAEIARMEELLAGL